MKKILLLGGSAQQVIAIITAKKLGYFTVLCDYLEDNPGQFYADKFYLLSTTDKKAILNVAISEKISGILAYASDPAAPTAAYVAEKLNLPGNPYKSVEILCNKDKFRNFLLNHGFNTPKSQSFIEKKSALKSINMYNLPIIIKPVDSSGSKGVSVIENYNQLENSIDYAFTYSRNNKIIIEEYVNKNHEYLIGGDIFVKDGEVILWGLLNCHRDKSVNELVPVGKSYPLKINNLMYIEIKKTLNELIQILKIKNGAMNVELVVDKKNKVWPIDIGPRNGGNMIPDLLGIIYNVDLVKLSIETAMGISRKQKINNVNNYYATHNLHSNKTGKLKSIKFDKCLEKHIIRKHVYKKEGDIVEYFDNASKALGIIFLRFDTEKEMHSILNKINDLYFIEMY